MKRQQGYPSSEGLRDVQGGLKASGVGLEHFPRWPSLFVRQPTPEAVLAIFTAILDLTLLHSRLKCASPHVHLLRLPRRRDIEVKDIHGHAERRAGIWNVNNAGHVALDWSTGEKQVDLVVAIPEAPKIFDAA